VRSSGGPLPRQAEDRSRSCFRVSCERAPHAREAARIGEVSNLTARATGAGDAAEHPVALAQALEASRCVRASTARDHDPGGCGDTVRTSPVARCGTPPTRSSTARPLCRPPRLLLRKPDFANLPRKHTYIPSPACNDGATAGDQLRLARRRGARGSEGFAVLVGGGLRRSALAPELGVFVRRRRRTRSSPPSAGAWADDLRYPRLRVKRVQIHIEIRRGRNARARRDRIGRSSRTSRCRRSPSSRATTSASRSRRIRTCATSASRPCRSISATRFAVANLSERWRRRADHAPAETSSSQTPLRLWTDRRRLHGSASRSTSIPCAGNSSRAPASRIATSPSGDETRLDRHVRLEETFGLQWPICGCTRRCPHSCAQHWIARPGLSGNDRAATRRRKRQAIRHLRTRRPRAGCSVAKPLFRRVPTDELDVRVEGLIAGWIEQQGERRDVRRIRTTLDDGRARRPRRSRA